MTLDRIAKGVSVDGEKESTRTELCYTPTLTSRGDKKMSETKKGVAREVGGKPKCVVCWKSGTETVSK